MARHLVPSLFNCLVVSFSSTKLPPLYFISFLWIPEQPPFVSVSRGGGGGGRPRPAVRKRHPRAQRPGRSSFARGRARRTCVTEASRMSVPVPCRLGSKTGGAGPGALASARAFSMVGGGSSGGEAARMRAAGGGGGGKWRTAELRERRRSGLSPEEVNT